MPIELDDRGRALENEYFRRKEQELLEKLRAKIKSEEAKNLQLKCPKCDGTLYATNFENIEIDVCDKCEGVWIDPSEFAQIVNKDEGGWFGKIFG